ncbi:MAG: histidine decarboxylase [Hungateiclostridium thermocellum]|nr:histidine decarboxylase [Acetivibrio thermocellus]
MSTQQNLFINSIFDTTVTADLKSNSESLLEEIDKIYEDLYEKHQHYLGYPFNLNLEYAEFGKFLNLQPNNLGDAFYSSTVNIDTKKQEREVLKFFADVYKLPWEEAWGYIGHGGTEGNLCGMLVARERYPDGIFYFSEASHYSIKKNAWILGKPGEVIPSQPNGEFDYNALIERILKNGNKPVLLVATLGTTMTGAIDNVQIIVDLFKKHNIKEYHIHYDGALFGGMIPFIENGPELNFETLPIDSIAISGHKFVGCPMPAGIFLTRKKYIQKILENSDVSYVGTKDTTISGCRNGLSALLLWYQINRKGVEGFKQDVRQCMEVTAYAKARLDSIGWNNFVNPWSNTIVIDKPNDAICNYWSLACEGDKAHIIIMQHVTKEHIDLFIEHLLNSKYTIN